MIIEAKDSTFEQEVLMSKTPVLLYFTAAWCGPCKVMKPLVEQFEAKHATQLKVVRVDVDLCPMVAASLQIQSVPTLFGVKEGKVVAHHSGAMDASMLTQFCAPWMGALQESSSGVEEIKPDDLKRLLAADKARPIDLREPAVFARYHVPGAINVPLIELETRKSEWAASDGKVKVFYSRSDEGIKELKEVLQKLNVEVSILKGGFLAWEAAGCDVERGSFGQIN